MNIHNYDDSAKILDESIVFRSFQQSQDGTGRLKALELARKALPGCQV